MRRQHSTLNPRTRGIRYERDGGLRCVVSWLLRVSGVMTSQDTGGVGLPDGGAVASACWRGQARLVWWLPASSGCTARGWGRHWRSGVGVLQEVGPSCSTHDPWPADPDPRGAGRLGPTRANSGRGQSRVIASVPQRRRRAGDGGADLRRRRRALPQEPRTHSCAAWCPQC